MSTGLKACRDCGSVQTADAFPRYSGGRGFKPICRDCVNRSENIRRKDRREHGPRLPFDNTRYERFRERFASDLMFRCNALAQSAKQRATKKGWKYDLTGPILFVMMHSQSLRCIKTGVPFDFSPTDQYSRNPCAPSIDRKDNAKGYTVDNIQIVAAWYNLMKNEWSDDDVRSFIWTAFHSLFGDHS